MSLDRLDCQRYVYLADDDADDRELFVDAFREVDPSVVLIQAEDGLKLMELLSTTKIRFPGSFSLISICPAKADLNALKK